jgi:fructuronate reductase
VKQLNRHALNLPPAPIRIVHLGLGAFHRAHQAWYTERANANAGTGDRWGIAAFTGRSPRAAEALAAQDGLYTLITRAADGDSAEVMTAIVEARDGADAHRWRELLAAPTTAVVTLTVTEAGYRRGPDGKLDLADPDVAADIRRLRARQDSGALTAPGRLVDGLRARREAGGLGIAVISCDNIAHNGEVTKQTVLALAIAIDTELSEWIRASASFVSTMVDRITPGTTAGDIAAAAELTGYVDNAPVVAEPFSEWVLAGGFPVGRPAWEAAGARFVANVAPYEQRKLWLLNASHSLLAYTGLLRGRETIAQAMEDPCCVQLLEQLWADARAVLPSAALDIDTYLDALRCRFTNPRIRHQLKQIAADGSVKLPMRAFPVIRKRLAEGKDIGTGEAALVAAWILHLSTPGNDVNDGGAGPLAAGLGTSPEADAELTLSALAPDLAGNAGVVSAIAAATRQLNDPASFPESPLRRAM